jgi:hypothetical protein
MSSLSRKAASITKSPTKSQMSNVMIWATLRKKNLYNEELHSFHSPSNIIRMTNAGGIRWTGM